VLLGLPVATLTTVYDHHGAHAEAEALLQLPVLDAMFQTPAGLQYLRARGHHRLATGEAHAAIQDFERCRDLSLEWGRDLPAALPWRGDLAEAHLALGNRERARELARDQLARLGSGWTRSQGVTTRILAAACDLTDRPALLRDAVELLQSSGDRLELARACTELSEALDALGDEAGARQARRMLERFLAEPAPVDGRLPGDLSEAESRVATLAIQGRTNRQIAEQLNVTVSTVEQHLTRVYRKLNLRGRSELLELPLDQSGE
jgi:DNA-binding CsgD family transcriptional regulator